MRGAGWTLALALLSLLLLAIVTPLGRYLARAAWEEGKILGRRRSIIALIADSTTTDETRRRLQLVVDARRFALETLALDGGESFTTYSALDRDTLVLVLSAARRDTLAPHTWWFPVVGRFPYKGFFDPRAARDAAAGLERRGLDTWLRPASAFSTLGWFNDPLLSTTLRLDTLDLANTVIHELTHNTLFLRGEVPFNESFASFVGARGAAEFFRARGAPLAARQVEREWEDEKLLGSFWGATLAAVDSAYAMHPGDSASRVAARDTVFSRMREVLRRDLAPHLPTVSPERLQQVRFDNASLLARRVYAADPWLFDAVHLRTGGTVRETVALVARVVRADPTEPFGALRRWLAGRDVTPTTSPRSGS